MLHFIPCINFTGLIHWFDSGLVYIAFVIYQQSLITRVQLAVVLNSVSFTKFQFQAITDTFIRTGLVESMSKNTQFIGKDHCFDTDLVYIAFVMFQNFISHLH